MGSFDIEFSISKTPTSCLLKYSFITSKYYENGFVDNEYVYFSPIEEFDCSANNRIDFVD